MVEMDWIEYANCTVDDVADSSFIRPPTDEEVPRWRDKCRTCEVLEECRRWATTRDENGFTPSGVWAAGEWRE